MPAEKTVQDTWEPSPDPQLDDLSRPDIATIERRILRRLDLSVVPVLCFLFLVSFVDRGNIGNAHIQGLDKSLHMTKNDYNIAVMVFTLGYVVFGLPANFVFKMTGPKSLSVMIFLWGICAMGQGLTKSWGGLVACRFLMGVFEAGFIPGAAYLIGAYYRKDEFLKRYAVFFSASILAGAFNGLLAYAISHMNGVGGYEGWRWIFIIEGLVTIVVSFVSYFIVVPFPEETTMFSPEEKRVLLARLEADGANFKHDKLDLWTYIRDWKIWLAVFAYIGAEENASSVVAFQPAILKGIGYSSTAAQVHTIPVYMTAFAFSLTGSYISERLRQRYLFAMLGVIVATIGLAIETAQPRHHGVRYLGMFFLCSGPYLLMPILVVWLAINVGKGYQRTVALGCLLPFGNTGAFISSNVFITTEAPKYHTGFSVGLGLILMSGLACTLLYAGLRLENSRRDKYAKEQSASELQQNIDEADMGEKHPSFRYQL